MMDISEKESIKLSEDDEFIDIKSIKDGIEQACANRDVYAISKVFGLLRTKANLNYSGSMYFVMKTANDLGYQISKGDLEEMLYEASADSEMS